MNNIYSTNAFDSLCFVLTRLHVFISIALGPDLDLWRPQGSLCVAALSTSRKYYSRSRKYYYQLALLKKYIKPALTRGFTAHDCGGLVCEGPWTGAQFALNYF